MFCLCEQPTREIFLYARLPFDNETVRVTGDGRSCRGQHRLRGMLCAGNCMLWYMFGHHLRLIPPPHRASRLRSHDDVVGRHGPPRGWYHRGTLQESLGVRPYGSPASSRLTSLLSPPALPRLHVPPSRAQGNSSDARPWCHRRAARSVSMIRRRRQDEPAAT